MIHTRLCDVLGIAHPIVMGGMGSKTDARSVAAVSAAGGLGILGCTWRPLDRIVEDIRAIRRLTDRPFGVNFVLHLTDPAAFEAALAEKVPVFSFFQGQPADAIAKAHAVGAVTIHQVNTPAGADEAVAAGADILVAQGREAGGHMGPQPLWTLLPQVLDRTGGRPVLAAGGLVDGRDLAAALSFGAAGVLMGTRFLAATESPISPAYQRAILASGAGDTVASGIWDLLRDEVWSGVQVRAIRNEMTDRWVGHEDELRASIEPVRKQLAAADDQQDPRHLPLLAGEGAARITRVLSSAEIIRTVVADAEQALARAAALIG